MQKAWKKILSFGLAIALCVGVTAAVHSTSAYVVSDAAAGNYYSPITATGGLELLGQVHDLITSTHTKYTSYDECRDYGPTTDPALSGSGVVEFYTHETITTYIGSSGKSGRWNREHVWAQADSSLWGTSGGGSDLHHIRPSEKDLNATRGNKKFGTVTNGTTAWSKTESGENSKVGGTMKGDTFEPIDEVKGDVARIVMYLYTHYNTYGNVYGSTNGNGSASFFGTLNFTDIISASTESEAIKLLLEWNEADQVDPIETTRNEEAFKVQKNRNPFIDHPEYANAIWGDGTVGSGGTTAPAGSATVKIDSFKADGGYGFYPWSAGELSGTAYIFGGNHDNMQFNNSQSSYYLASTTAAVGGIKSVTVKTSGTEKEWKLLTSDTPYGEVAGKPTSGTDQGSRTVTTDGVTWEVEGGDAYFALVYEGSGVCYLESVVIEYGSEKLNAFRTAVSGITPNGTLAERLVYINRAITAYKALSSEEKTQGKTAVDALISAIAAYNATANSYNEDAFSANKSALYGIGELFD